MPARVIRLRANRQVCVAVLIVSIVAAAATMLAASPAIKALDANAQAARFAARTVNAVRQAAGVGCGETRLVAAVAFRDKTALKAQCVGPINGNVDRYMILTGTGIDDGVIYMSRKFFSKPLNKWRVTVLRRS